MNTTRYFFSNFIEDDTLSILAITAKEMLQEIDSIVKIYQKNTELLYGQSPKQILFLMKQNNKPLYSPSPSSGNNSCVAKSDQGPSTPVSRNSNAPKLQRILLPNLSPDDSGEKISHSGTMETITPVRHQTVIKYAATSNPDETAKVEQFASPVGSTDSPGASNQDSPNSAELAMMIASFNTDVKDFSCKNKDAKILNPTVDETSKVDEHFVSPARSTGSPKADNQESSRSAEIVIMTESLTVDDKEVERLVITDSNTDVDNRESPRSAEIIRMIDNLAVKEKDTSLVSARADGEFNASNQGFPRTEVIIKTSSLIPDHKESRSLVADKRVDKNTHSLNPEVKSGMSRNPDPMNKESLNPVEETFKIPKPIKVGNETPSPVKRFTMGRISELLRLRKLNRDRENRRKDLMVANSATDTDFQNPGETAEKSINPDSSKEDSGNSAEGTLKILKSTKDGNETSSPVKSVKKVLVGEELMDTKTDFKPEEKSLKSDNADSNKDSANHDDGSFKIPNPIEGGNQTPSPIKRSKMCGISAVDIQRFSSPDEAVKLVDSSPEDTRVSVSPIQGVSPNEASQGIVDDEKKRKSPTPKRRNATVFRSIPRVIQSAAEAELDIEVPCDSDNPSPQTSRISSATNSPINRSPDDSPKIIRKFFSERAISIISSLNASRRNSPGSDDDNACIGNQSNVSSIDATVTEHLSCKSESSVTYNETDYSIFKQTAMKFNTLCTLRHQVVLKIFTSLSYFRKNLGFLNNYAKNVVCIVNTISSPDKEYYTNELKETVNDATAIASKLMKKFTAWETDIDLDINTWKKCFEQIKQLKTQYGPCETDDGKPLMTMETLQVYEHELKAIWKRMDDMVIMGDTRRSLFSQTAHDFEQLIKNLVKCLIMVGVLQPR